jgi:hypothetical protein
MRALSRLIAVAVLAAGAFPARADIINVVGGGGVRIADPTTDIGYSDPFMSFDSKSVLTGGGVDGLGDSYFADVTLRKSYVFTSTSSSFPGDSSAFAKLSYNFFVVGPRAEMVPIRVSSVLADSGSRSDGGFFAYAGISILTNSFNFKNATFSCATFDRSGCGYHRVTFTIDVKAIDIKTLSPDKVTDESANNILLQAGSGNDFGAYGSGLSDPMLTIDPVAPDAADFRLYLNTGMGNGVADVPEPATWATLLIGLFGAGAALRARRCPRGGAGDEARRRARGA